jgi:hypothetical protein
LRGDGAAMGRVGERVGGAGDVAVPVAREERRVPMKAPVPLPFVKKGEEVPPTGLTVQAVLGFLLPFLLIALAGIIIYFMISAQINEGAATPEALMALVTL